MDKPINLLDRSASIATPQFLGSYQISESVCDDLIEFFKTDPHKTPGKVGGGEIDKAAKDSTDLTFYSKGEPIPAFDNYYRELNKALEQYKADYPLCSNGMYEWIFAGGNVQHYKPGGGFKVWHCERQGMNALINRRHLAFSTFLNTLTDEGGTEFYHQNYVAQPIKGNTIIFPCEWMFTHRGRVSLTQEKYIATGWFSFLPND